MMENDRLLNTTAKQFNRQQWHKDQQQHNEKINHNNNKKNNYYYDQLYLKAERKWWHSRCWRCYYLWKLPVGRQHIRTPGGTAGDLMPPLHRRLPAACRAASSLLSPHYGDGAPPIAGPASNRSAERRLSSVTALPSTSAGIYRIRSRLLDESEDVRGF